MGKINSKKTSYDGIEFDSLLEKQYYEHLKGRDDVKNIVLQPQFILMEEFYITCGRCDNGKKHSPKTGNIIKCSRCKGTGKIKRRSWRYTADFEVTYTDDTQEIIEVKGHPNERFPLVRKMFEHQYGFELTVIKRIKGEWVRK